MHKILKKVVLLVLLATASVHAQETKPTKQIVVKGDITKVFTITQETIKKANVVAIPDVVITNHLGEPRKTLTKLKGVLLKDLLAKEVIYTVESPKYYSEYYFIFEAADGYKVVYSWNELFNSETGNHVFLITSVDGKNSSEMDDSILTLCTTDKKTGRRHVKFLKTITVQRV